MHTGETFVSGDWNKPLLFATTTEVNFIVAVHSSGSAVEAGTV